MSFILTPKGRREIISEERDPHEDTYDSVHILHHLGEVKKHLGQIDAEHVKAHLGDKTHDRVSHLIKGHINLIHNNIAEHGFNPKLVNKVNSYAKDKDSAVHSIIKRYNGMFGNKR